MFENKQETLCRRQKNNGIFSLSQPDPAYLWSISSELYWSGGNQESRKFSVSIESYGSHDCWWCFRLDGIVTGPNTELGWWYLGIMKRWAKIQVEAMKTQN